jgi:cell division protein FtsW
MLINSTSPGLYALFANWWRSIDRLTLVAILIILAISAVLVTTASPAVAERIGLESFYFLKRQLAFLVLSIMLMFGLSMLSPDAIRRLAILGFIVGILLLLATLAIGTEIKGSKRWISIVGFSLQPSEFIKPCFFVVSAWVLSRHQQNRNHFSGIGGAVALYALVVVLILLQPDFGMAFTVSIVFGGQLFLAGLSMIWVYLAGVIGIIGVVGAYFLFPHVSKRINGFIDPGSSDNYQISRALEAFQHGGVFGTGPGEGKVKWHLPDSHTDFIFAVMGEEFGFIPCAIAIGLYAAVVIRGFMRIVEEEDLFIVFAVSGILMQFGLQAVINMGVNLHILPTKGMTLPFISYGGSSMMAIALAIGMMLALTRRRYGKNRLGARYSHRQRFRGGSTEPYAK